MLPETRYAAAEISSVFSSGHFELGPDVIARLSAVADKVGQISIDLPEAVLQENRGVLAGLQPLYQALAAMKDLSKNQTALVYQLYNVFCRITYALCRNKRPLDATATGYVNSLNTKAFAFLEPEAWHYNANGLQSIWQRLDGRTATEKRDSRYYSNYDVLDYDPFANQIHIGQLPEDCLDDMRRYLLNTRLVATMEGYFRTSIGICNLRSWRYLPGESVNAHLDRITPAFLKIMIYRGSVSAEDGCFEFVEGDTWRQVVGEWPVLVCQTTFTRHRALSPQPGRQRDCIELIVQPRLEDDLALVQSGYGTSAPKNPFASWTA